VVEKFVDRIVEKQVIVEVKVPEIVERVVERIVYLDKKVDSSKNEIDQRVVISKLFDDILSSDEDVIFKNIIVQIFHSICCGISDSRETSLFRANFINLFYA
jgi:hypothetical protein